MKRFHRFFLGHISREILDTTFPEKVFVSNSKADKLSPLCTTKVFAVVVGSADEKVLRHITKSSVETVRFTGRPYQF
jgi:hypothetical protein